MGEESRIMLDTLRAAEVVGPLETLNDTSSWFAHRDEGIGASRLPVITGDLPAQFCSRLQYALELNGAIDQKEATTPMRVGTHMEPLIRELFAEDDSTTAKRVERDDEFGLAPAIGTLRHKTIDCLYASVDDLAIDNLGITHIEYKNVGMGSSKHWRGGDMPRWNWAQCQAQMGVLSSHFADNREYFDHCYLVGLLNNRDLEIRLIRRDDDWIKWAFDEAQTFWSAVSSGNNTFFLDDVDGSDSTKRAIAQALPGITEGEQINLGAGVDELSGKLEDAIVNAKHATEEVNLLRSKLQLHMGNATRGATTLYRVSWPVMNGRKKLDEEAFTRTHPDIKLSEFMGSGGTYRGGLRVSRIKS